MKQEVFYIVRINQKGQRASMIRSGDTKDPYSMVVEIDDQTYVVDNNVGSIGTFFLLKFMDKRLSVNALDYIERKKKRLRFTFHIESRYTRNGILPLIKDSITEPGKIFNAKCSYYLISILRNNIRIEKISRKFDFKTLRFFNNTKFFIFRKF